ncbi:MAG: iron ABC transporter permease, partial [Synergistaceae bacterium]|nr:iron ABC transporter permease [Synergistaceae bacterium]
MTADKDAIFFVSLSGAVILLFCVSLTIGRFPVPLRETLGILASRFAAVDVTWTPQMENVILKVRLPRLFGALLVGGALSVSGAAYQSVFRNPLVSPDLLGVSSGACVGASAAILLHFSAFGVQ